MDTLDISALTIDESDNEIVILASDPVYFSDQKSVLWDTVNGGFFDQRNPPTAESIVVEWDDYQDLLTKQNQGYSIDNVDGHPVATQITGDTATQPAHYGTIADGSTYGHVKIGTNIDNNNGLISVKTASRNDLGLVRIGTGLNVTNAGVITVDSSVGDYTLPTASPTQLGGVKVGDNLTISGAGVLSATVPTASSSTLGGVKVGSGLSIDSGGVLSSNYNYDLPTASSSTLGGVKVGSNLSISQGILSANAQTPLIGGASGTGNAITELTVSGRTITPKKTKTFALATETLKTSSGYYSGNSSLTGSTRTLSLGLSPIFGTVIGFEGSGYTIINQFNGGHVFTAKATAHLMSNALEIETTGTTTMVSNSGGSTSNSFTGTTNSNTATTITQTSKTVRLASVSSSGITLPAELNQHGCTYFYTFVGR